MELKELSKESLDATRATWLDMLTDASLEVFVADYPQVFDRIDKGNGYGPIDDRLNESIFFAIEDDDKVVAIVESVQARSHKGIWIKMLDIVMSPEIELSSDTEDSTQRRLEIFKAALHGLFVVTKNIRKANTFKIYGRTELLIAFLHGMHDAISTISSLGMLSGIAVTIEGRWLVFRVTN